MEKEIEFEEYSKPVANLTTEEKPAETRECCFVICPINGMICTLPKNHSNEWHIAHGPTGSFVRWK